MPLDRRTLLVSLAGATAALSVPQSVAAAFAPERFAAARKDDRGTYSAALFDLVTADASGAIVAASAPKGGLITYWDVATRRFLGTCALGDGCGLAPTHQSASCLLTSGDGSLATGGADGNVARRSSRYHWDNHAILVR